MPSFTRANSVANLGMTLPAPTPPTSATRRSARPSDAKFVGLVIRPTPTPDSPGPATCSRLRTCARRAFRRISPQLRAERPVLASDRWDIRRAIVLDGTRRAKGDRRAGAALDRCADAQLYWISRRGNGSVYEVGIFASRFSGDDAVAADWEGKGQGFGAMLPVGQSFTVAGEGGGWRRESYLLASEPPSGDEARDILSVQGLQREGH